MQTFRTFVLFVVVMLVMSEGAMPLDAQTAQARRSDSVSIQISLQKNSYAIGEKPIAVMTIKNTSSHEIWFSTASHLYRVHVRRDDSEPQKTEYHRHMLGDFRAGDGPGLRTDSGGRSIAARTVDSQKYDLSAFYDLSKPGNYSVYLEIYDPAGPQDGSGHWLRTNTVSFDMQAPKQ